jgi:hypothetical protein
MFRALAILNQLETEGLLSSHAIGGGMAVLFHAEPVLTYDLDVFIVLPAGGGGALLSLSPIYDRLRELGYTMEREAVMIEGVPVQLIPAYNPLVEEAVAGAVATSFRGIPTRVISYEHLLALMVQTGRPKDLERLRALLDQRPPDEERLRTILERHGLASRWAGLRGA